MLTKDERSMVNEILKTLITDTETNELLENPDNSLIFTPAAEELLDRAGILGEDGFIDREVVIRFLQESIVLLNSELH